MNPAAETMLPLSVLASRFEKRRDQMRRDLEALPWWQWRRRCMLAAAAATYEIEHQDLLKLGGACVMERLKIKEEG